MIGFGPSSLGTVELGPDCAVLRAPGAADEVIMAPSAADLALAVRERWGRGVRLVGRSVLRLDVVRRAA